MVVEKDIIEEKKIEMDPFTEAEVLNASSTNENIVVDEEQDKESNGLIKRFASKSFFGSSFKSKEEPKIVKEKKIENKNLNNISINKKEDENLVTKETKELSLNKNISVKNNSEKNEDDMLDIPTFLRRQRD